MRESKKNPAACTAWELVYSNSSEAQKAYLRFQGLALQDFQALNLKKPYE